MDFMHMGTVARGAVFGAESKFVRLAWQALTLSESDFLFWRRASPFQKLVSSKPNPQPQINSGSVPWSDRHSGGRVFSTKWVTLPLLALSWTNFPPTRPVENWVAHG